MNELNTQFPGILLGYVSNVGYHLSSDECNELTKLWSHNEYNYDKLKTENDWYKEKNLEWQKKYDTDTEKLRAENERLKEAAKGLICSLPDSEIDMCSDVWGWTNIGVLKHWRDKLQQALNEVEE